jgi:hypothetical protein
MPPKDRLDESPDPDGGFDLKKSFDIMIDSQKALHEIIEQQVTLTQQQLSMERQAMQAGGEHGEMAGHLASMQYLPQMSAKSLKRLATTGGIPSDVTLGMARVGGVQALTSLQGAQAWVSQHLGQAIADRWGTGERLYEPHAPGFHPEPGEKAEEAGSTVHTPPGAPADSQPGERPPRPYVAPPGPRGRLGGGLRPMGQQIAEEGAAAAGRPSPLGDQTSKIVASVVEAAAKGSAEGAEEGRAGLLGEAAGEAAAGARERIAPEERPHVPLPAETVGGAEQAAEQGAPSPGAPAPAPGGPGGPPAPPGGPGGAGGGGGGGGGTGGPGGGTGGPGGPPPTTRQQVWQNVGARVAASGGSPGGILGMLKHIPGVGLAIDLAESGAKIYSEQREAGRVYQEQEGGTNLGAQTERAHAFAYEASMFGRVPEGVAGQMFGDVTGMGFTQRAVGQGQQLQNRQSALDFMYHQYTGTGTDIEQSAKILATASQDATVSLKSVGDAMTEMSDTAGKAGVNAKGVRDNFNSLLDVMIKMGAGPGAPQLAGGLAATQASYGRAFAGTSMAGQGGPYMQYMMAGQYGIAPSQVQYLQRTQPKEYARMLTGSGMQFVQQLPGMSPDKIQGLQSMIAQAGGGSQVAASPDLQQQVADQFLNTYQGTDPNLDMNIWAAFLSQVTGIKFTPQTVMLWVVNQVAGNTVAAHTSAGQGGGTARSGGGGAGAPVSAAHTGGAAAGKYGLAQSTAAQRGQGARGSENITPGRTWQQVLKGTGSGAAAGVYLGQEGKTGKRSPVLEALLQNLPKGAKVSVQTSSGARVMSVEDAMKYYPDEMAAGNVQFYAENGQNLGNTATVTQGLTDPTAQQGSQAEAAAKGAGARAGEPISKAHVGTARGADAKTATTTIDLTTEAKQLLKLLPSNSDNAAAAATVPSPPYVTSPSR